MMRALEVMESTGRSILSFRNTAKKTRPFRLLYIGLQIPPAVLYRWINERADHMMEMGLLEETRSLLAFQHLNALQTVGYTELFEYLNGHSSLQEAILRIKQNTRHYAKRQMTWFRKNPAIHWVDKNYMKEILTHYRHI